MSGEGCRALPREAAAVRSQCELVEVRRTSQLTLKAKQQHAGQRQSKEWDVVQAQECVPGCIDYAQPHDTSNGLDLMPAPLPAVRKPT